MGESSSIMSEKIYIAGHTGMVGSAIVRKLQLDGFTNLVLRSRHELDLLDGGAVRAFFAEQEPDYVIDSAARVGGIKANMGHPAEFLYENLQIQNNLIWAAKDSGVKKFVFLASSCMYPRACPQPMSEEFLFGGEPEPTNEAYAYAKISGLKLCEYVREQFGLNFTTCVPTNIFGENDNFDLDSSHVIPALMRRVHQAKVESRSHVVVWGDGTARREFLHVDDLASAIVWFLKDYDGSRFLNIGTGEDISIRELALTMKAVVGYRGEVVFDASKPSGMPRKLLDVSRLHAAGWHHAINFEEGLRQTYQWYQGTQAP